MGRRSRAKRDRRLQRKADKSLSRPSHKGEPLAILRDFHKQLQRHSNDSPRQCWEHMVEMIAHGTGWKTETHISMHLWEHFPDGKAISEFIQCWLDEIRIAKDNRLAFSEPIGDLLEELEATNSNLGQYFTPMSIVRMMGEMNTADLREQKEWLNGLDPCCGTGRFMLDTIVHTDNIMMGGVDIDLWLLRVAMLNVRLLGIGGYANRHFENPDDRLQPFTQKSSKALRKKGAQLPENQGGVTILGGRSRFIHGDALQVDLSYWPNWLESSWKWTPVDWMQLKMARESVQEYRVRVIIPILKELGIDPDDEDAVDGVRFDYSMTDKPQANTG